MIRLALAFALLSTAAPGMAQKRPIETGAQTNEESGKPPQRIRNVQLQRGERCPPATSPDEIVVCGNLDEPYRIPKTLRDDKPIPAQNQAWANRVETIDEAGRIAGGVPNSCSPVGTAGETGCVSKMLRDYAADKRQRRADAAAVPGGKDE